jgi:general L-amino acid transport system substrate-binding protein
VILPEVISKEPLGPAVRQGDARFADIVRWSHFAMLVAEELNITAATADQALASDQRPEALRLLGKTGDLGKMLGLDNAWALHVIKAVGNYGEVFARHLAPIGLQRARSPNAMYTQGGLQYAPPFR